MLVLIFHGLLPVVELHFSWHIPCHLYLSNYGRNVFLEQPCLWNKGIFFIAIDENKPLSDQGPFDVVLHKVSEPEKWGYSVDWKKVRVFFFGTQQIFLHNVSISKSKYP